MSTLLDVLKMKELVLVENTPEKVEAVITEKNALLIEIISLEKQRNQLLTQAGFAPLILLASKHFWTPLHPRRDSRRNGKT